MQVVVRWLIFRGIGTTQKEVAQSAGYNAAVFSAVLNGTTAQFEICGARLCAGLTAAVRVGAQRPGRNALWRRRLLVSA